MQWQRFRSPSSSAAIVPACRGGAALSAVAGDCLFLYGGADRTGSCSSAAFVFHLSRRDWTKLSFSEAPTCVLEEASGAACVALDGGNRVYIHGGHSSEGLALGTLSMVDLQRQTAVNLHPRRAPVSHSHIAVPFLSEAEPADTFLLFGGCGVDGQASSNVDLFDVRTNEFIHAIEPSAASAYSREMCCAGVDKQRQQMLIYGGRREQTILGDFGLFDLRTLRWIHKEPLDSAVARCACGSNALFSHDGAGSTGGIFTCFGGFDGETLCGDLVHIAPYSAAGTGIDNVVTRRSIASEPAAPEARFAHASCAVQAASMPKPALAIWGGMCLDPSLDSADLFLLQQPQPLYSK